MAKSGAREKALLQITPPPRNPSRSWGKDGQTTVPCSERAVLFAQHTAKRSLQGFGPTAAKLDKNDIQTKREGCSLKQNGLMSGNGPS